MPLDDVWVTYGDDDYTLEFGDRLLGGGYQGMTCYTWWIDECGEWNVLTDFH